MTDFALTRRVLLAGLLALAAPAVMAEDGAREAEDEEEEDHVRARRALKEGNIRPLSEILTKLDGTLDGEIVGIEFERDGGRYIYEFKLVTPEGRLVSVYVDAEDGAVLSRREE